MAKSIDDYPVTSFVKRITLFSGGTAFLDGYNTVVASVALTLMGGTVQFSAVEMGLYGSMYLIGVFLSSFVGGKLGDRYGRMKIHQLGPVVVAAVSLVLIVMHNAWALILSRFIIGCFIGADYPQASSMVSEYCPASYRGKALSILMLDWYIGALIGAFVGFALYGIGDQWPLLLASTAIPAAFFAIGRASIPESARWLQKEGRLDEADAALKKVFGSEASVKDLGEVVEEEAAPKVSLGSILRQGYAKRFIFVATFWVCQCAAVTPLFIFGPTIMQAFGLGEGSTSILATALIYAMFMLGVLPAIRYINRMGRRPTVIVTFIVMGVSMFLLGFLSDAGVGIGLACFIVYAVAYGLQSVLDNIYPPELFPTEVRSSAIGTITSISKMGGAIAAQLFPIGLATIGLGPCFIIGAALSGIGLVVSIFMAPETKGKTLEESSSL